MAAPTPTQIRIPEDVKHDARVRAARDGTNLSHVVVLLLREYGAGRIPLPPPQSPDEQD